MRLSNVRNASPEQIRELQCKELEILKKLKAVLTKHNKSFFIIGGTLIGAIRNGGFIPWDDDVDLLMFRSDFEELYRHPEWLEGTHLIIQRSNSKINQHLTGMILKDTTTTFINKHSVNEDIIHSIGIDILPLDYRPVGKTKRYLQIIYAAIFSLYNADRVPDHQGKFLRKISKLPLSLVKSRKEKYKIWSWAQRKMISLGDENSGEVVELGVGYKALFRTDSLSWFKSTINKKFEDTTMPVPQGYDNYLHAVVGDYMQLPPRDSRGPKHNTYLVDTKVAYNEQLREPFINKSEK